MRKKMIYISMLMFMFTLFIACTREKPKVEAEIYSVTESDAAIMDLSDDVKINSTEDTVTTIENSDNEKEETDINEENSKPSKSTQGDNKTENKSETITGTIESIGDGKTVINKAITSDDVMVSSISNKQLVSIFLNSVTEFVILSSSDGGITSNITPATSDDLSINTLIEASGTYDGEDFIASKITIFNFQ